MTSRGQLVLLATVVLYLAGAANGSQPASALASALLGILLATYVLSRLAASGLRITRFRVPERVVAGQLATVVVEVANAALLGKPRARLRFGLVRRPQQEGRERVARAKGAPCRRKPARLAELGARGEEIRVRIPPLRRKARVELEVPIRLPWRGRWAVEGLRIEGSDPLGLYDRPERACGAAEVLALPAHWPELPVAWHQLLAPGTRLHRAALRTERGEFRSLRDYQPGDALRQVHWPASAHRNQLMVKEYERGHEVQVQVWLAPVRTREELDVEAELAISAAATLVNAFALAPVPTVLRAPHLPPGAQGPGRGEVFRDEVLAALAGLPYCTPEEARQAPPRWARDVYLAATLFLVSNSASVLQAMQASLGRHCWPVLILTARQQDLPGAVRIAEYDALPAALSGLGQHVWREVAAGGE
jgi:uncharacterized protein (DUF58 family)